MSPLQKPERGDVEYAIRVPSGDQAGLRPKSVSRRTEPPIEPMTKIPPPSRPERNAMRCPSGENAGCPSSAGESSVRLTGRLPPMRWR